MIVYLVFSGPDYEAVFSTKEKAQAYIDKRVAAMPDWLAKRARQDYHIEDDQMD